MGRWWRSLRPGEKIAAAGVAVTLFVGIFGGLPAYLVLRDRGPVGPGGGLVGPGGSSTAVRPGASAVDLAPGPTATDGATAGPTQVAAPRTTSPRTTQGTPNQGPALPYQADWSSGQDGWFGSDSWHHVAGMMVNDGSSDSTEATLIAPFDLTGTPDYTAEAEIQLVSFTGGVASFGIVVRAGDTGGGYGAGHCTGIMLIGCSPDTNAAMVWLTDKTNDPVKATAFEPKMSWHTYRVVAAGNTITLFIDGRLLVSAVDNRFLGGTRVGLWASDAQVNVRAFRLTGA